MKIKTAIFLYFYVVTTIVISSCQKQIELEEEPSGIVKISFKNKVRTEDVILNIQTYLNPFAEEYTISKLKYYISNVSIAGTNHSYAEKESYHLIDQADPVSQSFNFNAATRSYNTIHFLIGVDSARNTSGAQTGALDPINDMFWTWNSGYIMFKLEGNSSASSQVNHKIEYHIGGFKGENKVLKWISLSLPDERILDIREGKTSELIIEADVDKLWQGVVDVHIAHIPVCTTPGITAKEIAGNYSNMFKVTHVVNN